MFIHDTFYGPLGIHLLVWSECGWSQPFWPLEDFKTQQSQQTFGLMCEVALIWIRQKNVSYTQSLHLN